MLLLLPFIAVFSMFKIELGFQTRPAWLETVMADFNRFLLDHAAAEKKASGMAMSMALHYRDKQRLVSEMVDLSIEELQHFRECVRLLHERGLQLEPDEKDTYVNAMRSFQRQGQAEGLLDRLIVAGVIEARGCERFDLVATALEPGPMQKFYQAISSSEDRHQALFIDLARHYFEPAQVDSRLEEIILREAELVASLPHRAALH